MAQLHVEAALISFGGMLPTGEHSERFMVPRGGIVNHFLESQNQSMLDDAWFIPDVCENPRGIWKGLKRDGQEETLAYCGHPNGEFAALNGRDDLMPVPNMTFIVFLTPDLIVRKYRWTKLDPDGTGFPINHSTRFEVQIWPPQN